MPGDVGTPVAARIERDDVEPHAGLCPLRLAQQEELRSLNESPLLAVSHGSRRADACPGAAVAHLDEHEGRAVAHDQINFAEATVKVSRNGFETVVAEVTFRVVFPERARGTPTQGASPA